MQLFVLLIITAHTTIVTTVDHFGSDNKKNILFLEKRTEKMSKQLAEFK